MNRKVLVVAGVAVIALLLAVGIAGTVVLAQGPTPTTPPAQQGKSSLGQLYLQALAQRLGTTVDKLQQAAKDARTDAINQAVKQGLITQAQANRLLQNQNAKPGIGPFIGPPGNGFGRGARRGFQNGMQFGKRVGFLGSDVLEAAANALNMQPADVTNALRSGKTLADLAKSQNVDPSKVQTAIANAIKSDIDRAAKDGLITQDRANMLKSQVDPTKIDLSRPYLGFGAFHGIKPGGAPTATPTP